MTFEAIALTVLVAGWLVCAYLPWFLFSVFTRGHAGLGMLPLCLFAGVVGALAVPILGLRDGTGLVLSFVAAAVVPVALLAARRFAMPARGRTVDAPAQKPEQEARG
ncbi:MAG: hypothetical protein IT303_10075 [Dehalococcoidia bacterium]|nr:hypothetical protein [Dehalococcoidia bacterium]